MCSKSHLHLGKYLAEHYMEHVSKRYIQAFLIGCVQPDKNPVTYLKGSVQHQWLRGHNYLNAAGFMQRICQRLEHKKLLTIFDYYTLGKLIHYIADAFTRAHNSDFSQNLLEHRQYEYILQIHFLKYLSSNPQPVIRSLSSMMDTIIYSHQEYSRLDPHINNDAAYTLMVSCSVLSIILVKQPQKAMEC